MSAVKSAIAVPETVVGLADIPTGGRVGKFLENEGGAVGFRPKQAKEFVSEFHTDQYKDQQRQFQEADGILDKTSVAIQNPSLIANTVVESVAPMLAGGVAARGLMAGTRLGQMGAKGAAAAGAIGEGTMMAGSQASAIRQETDDGLLTPTQAGAAVATGLAGTLFGYLGGRVAQRFGLGDVDTMLARGANPQQVASEIAALPAKSVPRQVIEGAISEGFLEELPQSISEQIIQNLALGKDWSEGVEDAAVMGTLAGMAMGGGASLYNGMTRPEPQDGGLPPPAAGNEPPAAPPRGFAPTSERPVIDEAALGRAGVFPPAPAPIINERALAPAVPTPSQQMGLDPAAGPMSAAAALAVDTGASATMQQAAQAVDPETGEILEAGARVPEQKQATDTPDRMRERLGFIERQARVNGGWDRRTLEERDRLQAELAKAEPAADQVRGATEMIEPAADHFRDATKMVQPAADQSGAATEMVEPAPAIDVTGRTDEQLRVLERAGRDGWREAAVAEIQRRAAQQPVAAPELEAQPVAADAPTMAAPQAEAAPVADIKAVIAKQIPDMTDGDLQQAIAHYGPEHKRTAKLQKELQKRGQGAQTTAAIAPGDSVQIADGLGSDVDGQPGRVVSVRGDTASVEVAGERYDDVPVSELKKQAPAAASEGWDGMTAEQRAAVLTKPGGWSTAKGKLNVIGKKIAGQNWSKISPATRATIERLMQGEQTANVPTAEQMAPQTQEAGGQEGEKAKWIKATVDKSRLNGSSGIQIAVTPKGGVTFLGDPNTSKDGKALLANYEKALAAGATQQEIAAALQAQQAAPAERDRTSVLTERWNALAQQYKVADDQGKASLRPEMDRIDAELKQATRQSLLEGKQQIQKAMGERAKAEGARAAAMPVGSRLRPSEHAPEKGLYWEKTGQDEWTGRGDWFQNGKTRSSADLMSNGGLVEMAPEADATPAKASADVALTDEGKTQRPEPAPFFVLAPGVGVDERVELPVWSEGEARQKVREYIKRTGMTADQFGAGVQIFDAKTGQPTARINFDGEVVPTETREEAQKRSESVIAKMQKRNRNAIDPDTGVSYYENDVRRAAGELRQTIYEEQRSPDFAPSELPKVVEFAAKEAKVTTEDLRNALLRGVDGDERFSDGRKKQIREAFRKAMFGDAPATSTAPEHRAVGVDDRELEQIAGEFNDAQAAMVQDEERVHHLFDAPQKDEVVRLQDKVKVYHKDHGWMTPAEAKARIEDWKQRAREQGDKNRSENSERVVLSMFDLTGSWSKPWEEAGYQVYRFDIQDDPVVGDVNNFSTEFFSDWFGDFDGQDIYAILAACPCTDFAVSGARHFAAKDKDGRTVASVKLVHQTLAAIEYFKPAVWAIENPVGRIEKLGGLPPWRLSFDPNHLGDPYTKKTLLWGRFNGDLPIAPVEPTEGSKMHSKYGGKSLATKNARSATPEGFAYGFFAANNAVDNPVMAVANKYDRLDRDLIARAVKAGMTGDQIGEVVDDHYYMDLDDAAAEAALRDAIPPEPTKAVKPDDAPEFTTLKDRYGNTVTVRTDDLSGSRERMPMFTKNGKRKTTWIHRDNLDPTGEKQAEGVKEMADNPFFNVITTKDGSAFASEGAAERELRRLGLQDTHEVAPASEVSSGSSGFVVRRADTAEAAAPGAGMPSITAADITEPSITRRANPGNMGDRQYVARAFLEADGSSIMGTGNDEASALLDMMRDGQRKLAGIAELLEAADGEKAWNELSVPFGRTMALERAGVKLPAAVHWKNISPENRAKLRPAVKAVLEESDGGAVTARPQPGDDGYTLELAREDLAALRAELKKQGEDGRPVDSRLNDRVRNFEKLVASMESAQKREQPAQASDDDIDAMFDDALADAIGEQRTGEAEPTATAEAPAATAVTTEQPANQEAMAESLEDELRAQKKRVQRLRGGDATKLKVAEARLRAMRQSIFDAEDKWVPAARNGDQEALTKLEEAGFADTADAIRAFAPAAPRTAGKALKSAAKNAASALDDAINGLGKLFGGSGRLSSGLTFDEETYAKAKPLFIAAAANIRAASRDLRDVMKAVVDMVVERFGADTAKNMKPYVTQFVKDVRDGKVQLEQEQEGDEPAADGAQDQGRAEAVRGGRGDSQPGSAPADSGSVAPRQSEDGRPAGEAGDSGRSGVRVPGADVARGEGQPQGRASGDGRARTGGAGSPDAGAGGAGNAGDLGRVSSPAATSAQALDLHVDNPLEIVGGSPVQRFNRNRAALELLQTLTEEGRQATPDEQKVLAGYIGWGSFGQELFQGSWERPAYKDEGIWKERGQWLRETLGESAWKSAQRSITNAHYTDPPTVLAMWDMVRRMGFDGGKVLEPSMGTGNFFSMMPADLKARSQLTGIELDETTGAIAKQLFPRSNVRIMGYQDSKTPDGFYDLIIGNWPFENTPVADRRYNKLNPMLHDYFFLKTMDQVRPGGIVIGITSAGSMDKQNTTIRRELAKQAELVAAIRLPSGAFEEYAGTKVVTDIVVLRKRPQRLVATPSDATWVETGDYQTPAGETIKVNRYYLDNPQNIIGTLDFGSGTTTFRAGMIVRRPDNMAEQLQKAIELVPQGAMLPRGKVDHLTYYANETGERHGALALVNDRLMIAVGDQLVEANEARKYALKDAKKTAVREQQLRAAIELRKKHAALVDAERGGRPADDARKALRGAYDAFVKAHGGLRDSFALEYLERINDPFFAELAALENDDGTPAAVMERSTTRGRRTLDNPSVRDAYVLARNQSVNPSVAEVARLAGKSEQAVKAELLGSGAVFEAPNGDVVPSDIYLSGNVRQKLREAQAALDEGNAAMSANIAALKEVMPEDVPYFNIETQFGATWVPNEAYAQYIAHMLGQSSPKGIEVSFRAGRWKVKMEPGLSRIPEAAANYGTPGYPFSRLVQAAISNQVLRLTSKDENGNDVYDAARTEEANARIAKIREDFGAWLWSDPERRQDLEREYNEARNAWATPTYDGSFLTFEGMALTLGNGAFQLRQHQVNAIWRAIVNRRSINAHEVGTGKTFTMGGIAVESRRYGIAKKPMLLAHNANSATVAAEIRMMYPSARVLYVDNLQGDKKEIRLRQIANDDWDVIVVPHSLISSLALREETMMRMAEDDIKALEAEFFDAAREDNINPDAIDLDDDEDIAKIRSVTAKELAKARKRIIENIKKQAQKSSKEGAIAFEDLGVDMILVDEAHEFKKPPIVTRMKMKGLNTQVSNRSIALQFLTRYVRQMNNGGNVHTFTGTPITNTITEIYHQMRYVMEAEMEQATIADWDGWFGSFAAEVQDVELTAAGDYEMVSRLAGFVNVPELRAMVGQYMDTVFAEDMPEMRPRKVNGKELSDPALTEAERAELLNGRTEGAKDRPYKKVVNDSADMTAEQMRIFTRLQQYAREWRAATGKQKKEWMRAGDPRSPIITEGIANKASFDVRLLDDEGFAGQEGRVPDEPTSKASRVVKNVLEIYNSHPNANQVIFSETGFGKRATRSAGVHDGEKQKFTVPVFATMHDIVERLVHGGIPREQIAIVDGSTSKERRKEIAEAMNSSKIRVVIGSTDTLGVGVNMQRNLRAMHHVDAPYMPGELEQRNGRGLRQGNQWNTVLEYRYMTDRLDGKRWQILAVKQRFINAFMKAAAGTRVIEGEAAADEQSDILESFSEAAGDPRILQRVKMQKKLETLNRKERMYTQGIADMRRQERISAELADRLTRELKQLADSRTQANVEALIASQQQAFAATIDGTTYDTRKDAAEALQAFIEANVRIGDSMKTVGEYAGHPLRIEWPRHMDAPVTQIDAFGQEFAGKGIAGAEAKMRNFPSVIENKAKRRDMERSTAENMRAAMNQPFAQAADLERITKQLQDLEKDLEINPVPPPAWLRQGAPIDSEVHRNKRPYIVTGHRYSKDGWFVIAEDDKGTVLIPYMEATDEVGMPMYEEREFVPPVVIEKEKGGAAPAGAPADVVVARAAQSATTNPLRNADGTFARQDPAGDSLAFSATLPRDRNAVRIGITEKGLVRAMRLQFDGLADVTGKLLERGRAGKRGGVIVVGTADNAEIGRIVAERTGRKLDSTMRKFSSAGRLNGFYDPKTGLTFLVGPNLNPVTATAVMLHEMMHGQQRQKIDARALEMVRNRHSLKNEYLRAFLDRVMLRMIAAGEVGNAAEASAYIVEQAVIEGRSAGYTFADGAFMQWVDAKIGRRVGDFLRSFAGMIRTWMLRNGLGAKAMTVDDFVGYAMAGMDRAAGGEVRGWANARASIEESDQADGDGLSFSRSGVRALASRATTELNNVLTAPGKLSWWHKTIGTMYNLAERSPAFRPVFQAAQGFIDDVSHYAADAAERAPKLLPRLDTWRDIMKSPISAEDNTAVGKPIFEGTLSWTRDADGRPVRVDAVIEAAAGMSVEEMADELISRGAIEERTLRMWRGMPEAQFASAIKTRYENSFLQPGVVWTDDELASMFSLTPAQIALYREFRAAVDRSLDTMARADMLRFAGEDVRFLRDPVMEAETLREAASLIVMNLSEQANAQPDRAEQLMATGQGVMDRMQKVLKLQASGYAPLSRFGKYTVDVVVDGNREYFGLFETAREANKMAERMRAEFGAGTVTQGTLSDEAFRLFAGITPESLELFGNMLGLDSTGDEAQDRAFQEYLRLTKTNRSALRRLIHRKGIAGFSDDVGRVLASFAYSNARQTAAGLHMGDLSQAVSDIPKEQGELKDVAVKLAEYIKNPQEEAQAIRGLLFAQYLGGSVASAFVNMTQPAAVTFPWLSQHGGASLAAKELGKAAKHIATRGHRYESDLAEALKAAEEDGVVSPQEVHQLMAQARGSGSLKAGDGTRAGNARALASNSITRLSAAWGKLFSAAEQLNRRITFIAAYRVAKQKRMEDPAAFARRAVQETQFVYSKASKMQWGRGAVGGTLMTFKTYSVAYMELMSRLWSQGAPGSAERKAGRKAVALMLAMVLLMGGGGGLPFMEDMEDLIDGIAQIAGYNFSTKKARQQFLIDTFGADASDFIERGVSGLPGVPLDVSGRLGLGNLIPGTGMFLDRSNHTRDILELLGPVGDLGNRFVSGARKAVSGDVGGALLEVSPVALRNLAKGADMAATDQYRDYRGYKVLETNDLEAALKAVGFQPAGVAKIQDANYLNQRAKDFYNLRAQKIRGRWAEGIYERDPAKVQEARGMVAEWNADNPGQPMIIRMPDILRRVREMGKDKAQRIADTAPRAMRQQLREELIRQ